MNISVYDVSGSGEDEHLLAVDPHYTHKSAHTKRWETCEGVQQSSTYNGSRQAHLSLLVPRFSVAVPLDVR